jgi:hypothetical protein
MKIIRFLALILLGFSGFPQSHAADETAPFAPVKAAILETISLQLKYSQKSAQLFSIAMMESDGSSGHKAQISDEFVQVLHKKFPEQWKHYIPYSELRIPGNGERDPSDPEGQRLRGYESKDGKRVEVLSILSISYASPEKIIISCDCSSGFLSGGGGTYEVSKDGTRWKVTSTGSFDY